MILFTTGDILKLFKVPATTFDGWCVDWRDEGIVQPLSGGFGTKKHRQWSFMQAVGFAVAEEIRKSERGCVPAFYGQTVAAFGALRDEDELLDRIKKLGSCYVMPHYGKPHLQGDDGFGSFPNVKKAYEDVVKLSKHDTLIGCGTGRGPKKSRRKSGAPKKSKRK